MRGKGSCGAYDAVIDGITPAGAGKSVFPRVFRIRSRDHPRRCGEKAVPVTVKPCCTGSPPQVRGKVTENKSISVVIGITPAGAGKSCALLAFLWVSWDHPRRCGEKLILIAKLTLEWGSPPQVRGKAINPTIAIKINRITPAGAGKSASSWLWSL